MQVKYLLYIVLFLVSSFLLNILFYFVSPDYRNFLKDIKSDEKTQSNLVKVDFKKDIKNKNIIDNTNNKKISIINDKNNIKNIKSFTWVKVEYNSNIWPIKETNIEREFLKRFKEYNLKKLELHPRLFGLTTEYPNEYIEYYSEYLTVYMFWNEQYSKLKDIFKVLTYELPFSINEVNNFWTKSFYINLNNNFQDNQIRIVLLYKNRTFWLKIAKDVYPLVKAKLSRLK